MTAKSDVAAQAGESTKQEGSGFIKRNPWVLIVGVFAVLIVAGIILN